MAQYGSRRIINRRSHHTLEVQQRTGQPQGDEPYAFACYAHDDSDLVYAEIADLAASGYRIYYDEGIGGGRDWHDDLADAIDRCSLFIMCVTRRSVVSRHCIRELNYAHEKKKPVLAVHLEEVEHRAASSWRLVIGKQSCAT